MEASAGSSVHSVLRRYGGAGQAGRNGLEKKDPDKGSWDRVPMSYILKKGDVLRVAFPKQARAGSLVGELLTKLFTKATRRKRGSSRDRRRRK